MTASRADVQAKLDAAVAAIAAARAEVGDLVDPIAPPPPPTPTPTPAPTPATFDPDPFGWDATAATLDPNSAALAKAFVGYALPYGAYLAPNIAYAVVAADGSTPTYAVATAGKPGASCLDATLHVPVGTEGSFFHDHHLTIIDLERGRQHDLWRVTITNGQLTTWQSGSSIALGAITQPRGPNGGSNAAGINGMAGVVRPEQVAAHDLSHPIVFACPQPGQVSSATPVRYPSSTPVGWPYPGHLPPAAWLRFPAGLAFPSMDAASLYFCRRIQARGMFLSDQNTSNLSLKGADLGGNLKSSAAWAAAGVTLGSTSGAFKLSSAIPWDKLQVLKPPTP